MPVAVVKIGIVRVGVDDWLVTAPMRMRLRHRPVMRVLMMLGMTMSVLPSRTLGSGVDAPNKTAEANASGTPGQRWECSDLSIGKSCQGRSL